MMDITAMPLLARRVFLIIFVVPALLIVLLEGMLEGMRAFLREVVASFTDLVSVLGKNWAKRKD